MVSALPDLDNITVRVADIAANLPGLRDRLCNEFGSPAFPKFVTRLNVGNTDIHKAVDVIGIGGGECPRRLVGGRSALTLTMPRPW